MKLFLTIIQLAADGIILLVLAAATITDLLGRRRGADQ